MKKTIFMHLRYLVLPALLLLCSCSAKYQHRLEFNPENPLRVAVLPFYQVDSSGKIVNSEVPLFQLTNQPAYQNQEPPPAKIMMGLVEAELQKTLFDIVSPASIRAAFVHLGFTDGISYDYQKILNTPPKELCRILGCDALLYGKLTDWSQNYFIAETVNSIGLELKLVRASDEKILFSMLAEDSAGRGLSKGPTGYSDLVLEPLKGLREGVILELARKVADKSTAPLLASNSPEFKKTAAPVIFGASQDASVFHAGNSQPLLVLMIGTPGKQASFSIGNQITDIPMVELDRGHYRGEYFPLPGELLQTKKIVVQLRDQFGRKSSRMLHPNNIS